MAAPGTVTDDVTYYVLHRVFNTITLFSYSEFTLKFGRFSKRFIDYLQHGGFTFFGHPLL